MRARVGFDWAETKDVLAKVSEEAAELSEAVGEADANHIEEEFGDLLFVLANLSRHLQIDPENALRRANAKFSRRFRHIENALGDRIADADLGEMEALWTQAKELED